MSSLLTHSIMSSLALLVGVDHNVGADEWRVTPGVRVRHVRFREGVQCVELLF